MFDFVEPAPMADGNLELVLSMTFDGNISSSGMPEYHFVMRDLETGQSVGLLELRIGDTEEIRRIRGHIGYNVKEEARGRRFAARSLRLVLPIARQHGLESLWITCDPDNTASRRTAELAGAEYVETVPIPEGHMLFFMGVRERCRYRLAL